MLEQRIIELINADIDGELGQAEKDELQAILESSAEARIMRVELLKLTNLLDSSPDLEPPAELSTQILDKLAPSGGKAAFSLSGLLSSFQPVTAGVAFAAGLVLAVGFYELSPGRHGVDDTAGMVGTMVMGQPRTPLLLKNDLVYRAEGFTGRISLSDSDGMYVLNFDLESEERTEIEIGLEDTGFTFGGFAQPYDGADEVIDSISISGGTLRVVNQGRQQFAVFLRENSAEQALDIGLISIGFPSMSAQNSDTASSN